MESQIVRGEIAPTSDTRHVPVTTVDDVLQCLAKRDRSYVPEPLRFAVGAMIQYRYPSPGALKRYGVPNLQYEVVGVTVTGLRLVTLRKLFTKTKRCFDVPVECVNAWYDEVS